MTFKTPSLTLPIASENFRRIHIIGAGGSGKTTLARKWAQRIGATAYELDEIGYEGGFGPERSLDLRLADVKRIAEQPAWVTEGVFLYWTDELFLSADLIVWLDLPFRVCAYRILKRHFLATLARNNRHPGFLNLVNFLRWNRAYHTDPHRGEGKLSRSVTADCLSAHTNKLLHCRTPRDLNALAASL